MKRLVALVVGTLLLVGILGVAVVGAETDRIGIVDLAIVIDESSAGKKANAELNNLIASRQSALDALEADIVALETELEVAESTLSEEVKQVKAAQLDDLVTQYLTRMNEYEAEIQQLAQALQNQILSEIGAVLQWFGDNKDYSLILDSSTALYFRRVVDLTWEIIREYDDLKAAGRL